MPGHVPMPMPMAMPMTMPGHVHYRIDSQTGMQVPHITYHNGQTFQMTPMSMMSPPGGFSQGPIPTVPVQSPEELPDNTVRSRAGTQTSQQPAQQPAATTTVAQPLASPPHVVYAHPIPHPGGLSQSKSHHSGLATNATFASPQQKTPPRDAHCDDSGLLCSPSERLTEPRNYAPRAVALKNEAPPTWHLGANERADALKKAGVEDPFVTNNAQSTALVHNPGSPQQVIVGMRSEICELPGTSLSQALNKILKNGLPSFDVVMDPENFPFVESCRTGPAINHGVIKIRNVRCFHHLLPFLCSHACHRSRFLRSAQRSSPSSAATPKS